MIRQDFFMVICLYCHRYLILLKCLVIFTWHLYLQLYGQACAFWNSSFSANIFLWNICSMWPESILQLRIIGKIYLAQKRGFSRLWLKPMHSCGNALTALHFRMLNKVNLTVILQENLRLQLETIEKFNLAQKPRTSEPIKIKNWSSLKTWTNII